MVFMEQGSSIMLAESVTLPLCGDQPDVMPDASVRCDWAINAGRSMGVGARTLPKRFSQGQMWNLRVSRLNFQADMIHWTM